MTGRPRIVATLQPDGTYLCGDQLYSEKEWNLRQRRLETFRRSQAYRHSLPWKTATGSLHNLDCKGGHRQPRKGCTPVPVYSYEREKRA